MLDWHVRPPGTFQIVFVLFPFGFGKLFLKTWPLQSGYLYLLVCICHFTEKQEVTDVQDNDMNMFCGQNDLNMLNKLKQASR